MYTFPITQIVNSPLLVGHFQKRLVVNEPLNDSLNWFDLRFVHNNTMSQDMILALICKSFCFYVNDVMLRGFMSRVVIKKRFVH